jgi:nicotinamidase-related amidase
MLDVLKNQLPFETSTLNIRPDDRVGFIIVDAVVGFTRRGNLSAPERLIPVVERIALEHDRLRAFHGHVETLLIQDTHAKGIPEPPFPPHCEVGSGEEELDPALAHIAKLPQTTTYRKDCINAYVGATTQQSLSIWDVDYAVRDLDKLIVVGFCTDICVSELVTSLLSARNSRRSYIPRDLEIWVMPDLCGTFDAPGHPGDLSHHIGLWTMAGRGAQLAQTVAFQGNTLLENK